MATTTWSPTDAVAPASGLLGTATPTDPTAAAVMQPALSASGAASSSQTAGTPAAQYQATLQTVDPSTTTQGNLDKMLATDSPYLQRAQAKASEMSNSRGLLNSSMAAGAGTAAAIDAAAPIAQADAGIYANALSANQAALNSAGQYNSTQANQFGLADKNIAASKEAAAVQQGYTQANMDKTYSQADKEAQAKFGFDTKLMEIQKSSNMEVASMEAQYKNLTQASASAASIMNATASNVNLVMLNEKLDAAAKQTAISTYNANAQKSLQLIGAIAGDVELSQFMDTVLA